MLWNLALKEIKRNKSFTALFLINVMVGLLGLILIENFKVSFQSVLDLRAKNLLGADISLSSRFPIDKNKKKLFFEKVVGVESHSTELMTMFSMAKSDKSSRLVFLNTIKLGETPQNTYPYYGHLEIDEDKTKLFPRKHFQLPPKGSVWVYPEVTSQLGKGPIKIGNQVFKIAGVVTDDSQQTFEMGSVAPKVFIRHDDALDAGLVQKGSTIRYYSLIKTENEITKSSIEEGTRIIDDNAVVISTPKKSSEQVGRVLAYLSDFLGLVSLVALFLASVGLFYLYRSHLSSKRVSFAIYSSIGLSRSEIFGLYIRHILLLGFFGSLLGLGASSLVIPVVNEFLSYVLPFDLPVLMSPRAFAIGFLVGNVGVFLLSYPLILGALKLPPASLFQEVAEMRSVQIGSSRIHFIPYFVFFSAMAIYASNSLKVGSTFLGLFLGVALLAMPLCFLLLQQAQRMSKNAKLSFKLSMRYLNRYRISTVSIFLSLLLGSMLLNLVPMLQQSIQAEITLGESSKLPSLFLFDIQDEQVSELKTFFKDSPLIGLSPFIRGRIAKINDRAVVVETGEAVTREGQREKRFRNRGTNLSYRDELTESETLLAGQPFPGPYNEKRDGLPLISIETRYAKRLGIKLGDKLEFNILGIPLIGQVSNIRKVRWTSFIPNFFLQFQSGVLDDAPKTWLASVPQLGKSKIMEIQNRLYEKFPNISAVDISRVVKKILDVMRQMGWALKAMSFLCLAVGFFVLYSLASHQMNARKLDMVLLKVIGMGEKQLQTMVVREFMGIGFFASILGAGFGLVVSYIVTHLFFDGLWKVSLFWPIGSVIIVCALCFLTAKLASSTVLKVKASAFLN